MLIKQNADGSWTFIRINHGGSWVFTELTCDHVRNIIGRRFTFTSNGTSVASASFSWQDSWLKTERTNRCDGGSAQQHGFNVRCHCCYDINTLWHGFLLKGGVDTKNRWMVFLFTKCYLSQEYIYPLGITDSSWVQRATRSVAMATSRCAARVQWQCG